VLAEQLVGRAEPPALGLLAPASREEPGVAAARLLQAPVGALDAARVHGDRGVDLPQPLHVARDAARVEVRVDRAAGLAGSPREPLPDRRVGLAAARQALPQRGLKLLARTLRLRLRHP